MARQRLAGQERARAIVQAAMGLFAQRGFSGVKTRQIARAAGVSEALVFKHFPHKHSLYRTILQSKLREVESSAAREEELAGLDDEAYLAAIAAEIMKRVQADDTFLRLLLHSALEGHPLAREFRRARIDEVRARIERRIRLRYARRAWRGPVEPGVAARVFTGMIMSALMQRHIYREPVVSRTPIERWAGTLARIFLRGLENGSKA